MRHPRRPPAPGLALDADLEKKIKTKIRMGASPRHVPAEAIQVADIPRTKSGKIVELAVREVVHGRPVKNKEALANLEALELYAGLDALEACGQGGGTPGGVPRLRSKRRRLTSREQAARGLTDAARVRASRC